MTLRTPPSPALERYARTLRRERRVYYALIAAVVVVLGVVVAIVWANGEVANTTVHTVRSAPPSLAARTPSTVQQTAWRTGDQAAVGDPRYGGTVVVWSQHTVRGLDARTGGETWSYTRSDRSMCEAGQDGGTTFALYAVDGNCNELTALDSSTGSRLWTRTLDMDGNPVLGPAALSMVTDTVMFTSRSAIYAIDPSSGYNRWTFSQPGCTINGAVLGSSGALISQTCGRIHCGVLKYCGTGPQLLLRDGDQGRCDNFDNDPCKNQQSNPDRIKWIRLAITDVPLSADDLITGLDPAGSRIDVFAAATGDPLDGVALEGTATPGAGHAAVVDGETELVWVGGRLYALAGNDSTPVWTSLSSGPPTIGSAAGTADSLSAQLVTVATSRGIVQLDADHGREQRAFEVTAPPPGSTVWPLGTGFLVSGPQGSAAYR